MISGNILGNYKSAFHGKWLEFEEFRHREEGEDSDNIDWFISAREGKILTRRMKEERDMNVFHLIEITPSFYFWFESKKKFEILERTLFLISLSALQNGDKNAYMLSQNAKEFYLPHSKKKESLFQIYRHLELIKKHESNNSSHLCFPTSLKNNLLFIYTDSFDLDFEKLKVLALRNDIILIHIFDTFENTLDTRDNKQKQFLFWSLFSKNLFIDTEDSEKKELYKKLRQEKIQDFSLKLASFGIDYIMLDDSKNIYKEFMKCMDTRIKKR